MLVEICTPGGHLCSVTADCHSHIADIKNQIETATGIPRWEQRLISGQDQLRDGDFLNSIGKGTLNLLLIRRDSEEARWLKAFTEDSEKHVPSYVKRQEASMRNMFPPMRLWAGEGVTLSQLQLIMPHLDFEVLQTLWDCLEKVDDLDSCSSLRDAPEKIRSNREVVAAAVRSLGSDLVYASKELRGDKGLALLAIESSDEYEDVGCTDDGMFMHLSDELRADREVVAAALQHDATSERAYFGGRGTALRRASETLRNDKGFVLEAVRRFAITFHDVPRHLREDSDVILTALRHHPHMELGRCTYIDPHWPVLECPPQLRRQKEFVLKAAHLGLLHFVLCSSHDQWHDSADQNWANDQNFMQQLASVLCLLNLSIPWAQMQEKTLLFQEDVESGNELIILGEAGNGKFLEAVREWAMQQEADRQWNDVVYNRKQILEEARTRKWFRDSARQSRSEPKKQRSLKSQAVGQRGGRHKVPDIDWWDL